MLSLWKSGGSCDLKEKLKTRTFATWRSNRGLLLLLAIEKSRSRTAIRKREKKNLSTPIAAREYSGRTSVPPMMGGLGGEAEPGLPKSPLVGPARELLHHLLETHPTKTTHCSDNNKQQQPHEQQQQIKVACSAGATRSLGPDWGASSSPSHSTRVRSFIHPASSSSSSSAFSPPPPPARVCLLHSSYSIFRFRSRRRRRGFCRRERGVEYLHAGAFANVSILWTNFWVSGLESQFRGFFFNVLEVGELKM